MERRMESLAGKKLVGKRLKMTFAENRTFALWSNFMPRRKEIKNKIGTMLYSIQVYKPSFFNDFNPTAEFEKWAAVEVTDFDDVPGGMEPFILPAGLYAVFLYQGAASGAAKAFRYIFGTWLPDSGYLLDDRPHFEILGEKYKNEDPGSEEELWIPVKRK